MSQTTKLQYSSPYQQIPLKSLHIDIENSKERQSKATVITLVIGLAFVKNISLVA